MHARSPPRDRNVTLAAGMLRHSGRLSLRPGGTGLQPISHPAPYYPYKKRGPDIPGPVSQSPKGWGSHNRWRAAEASRRSLARKKAIRVPNPCHICHWADVQFPACFYE